MVMTTRRLVSGCLEVVRSLSVSRTIVLIVLCTALGRTTAKAAAFGSKHAFCPCPNLNWFAAARTPRSGATRGLPTFPSGDSRNHHRLSSSSLSILAMVPPSPPEARREEDRVVWCGVDNPQNPTVPRQSETSTEALLDPPVAVPDPYGWMRDDKRETSEILQHLEAENAYTKAQTDHLEPLRTQLYDEMVASIQETDYTVPRPKHDSYYYYTRTFQGKSYVVHCRAKKENDEELSIEWDGSAEAPILPNEQVLLDENMLAEGKAYCSTGHVKTSPSGKLLAYTVDFTGSETCQLVVKNIETDEFVFEDESLEIYGSFVWGKDDDTVFYLKLDAAQRPFQAYRRKLSSETEEMLWEEPNDLFWVGVSKTLDQAYLMVDAHSMETSEVWYLDLADADAELKCVATRRAKVLYDVEHRKGVWWITSNVDGTPNMRLLTCRVGDTEEAWKDVVLGNDGNSIFDGGYDCSLSHVTTFQTHVVAQGREGGIPRVWILGVRDGDDTNRAASFQQLKFDEAAHDVGLSAHYEFDASKIVVAYDSLITPLQHVQIDLADVSKRSVLKNKNVPNYDKSRFGCDRITVKSRDGSTEIPVSLVYRQDVMDKWEQTGEPAFVHLYGYGSYGSSIEADFRATRLPLLERGIVYVIAHVRGGGEMGRQWYEAPNGAKYLCKKNTFNDFVDVAKCLVDTKKLTIPAKLSCEGRSAGGLLIGASINQAPTLFKVAILGVPFVDVVCTMSDASIPLTCGEWEEWGCPNEQKFHQYMMEYSPINNIQEGATYPSCLLTGGLHDPRVQYWEPQKHAAQLRYLQGKESGPVCVKMDMTAGHFSASDRYKYLRELSFDFAFMLDQLGLVGESKDD